MGLRLSESVLLMGLIFGLPVSATEVDHEMEIGIGVGGQYLPDYRGSRETHTKVLPIPVVEYRGKIFKSDREGTRAEFLLSDRIEFNISADLALNDGAEDNP